MRKTLQLLSIATLLVWGALFLHFYVSGRIERHLDPSFRIYALLSGIGLLLLAGFNFLNRNRAAGECLHDHQGHDHHEHEHALAHDHEHHDHAHDHSHEHDHEETPSGVIFAVIVLLVPMLFATAYSRDQFSSQYLAKWGKIERQMMQMRIAEGESLGKQALGSVGSSDNPYTRKGIEGEEPTDADTPPEPSEDGSTDAADQPPEPEGGDGDGEADTWSTFTLDDLKQMVPQNDEGDFLLDVPQIFYTAGDRELMDVMEDIPVKTTAQLMEETLSNREGNRLKAFRLFIECCAADARPLSSPRPTRKWGGTTCTANCIIPGKTERSSPSSASTGSRKPPSPPTGSSSEPSPSAPTRGCKLNAAGITLSHTIGRNGGVLVSTDGSKNGPHAEVDRLAS